MSKWLYFLMFGLVLFSLPVTAADFSYQLPLETKNSEDATGFQMQLPAVVYINSKDALLRDVRVKNAQGDEVPMRLTLTQDDIQSSLSAITLPIFSLNHTVNTPLRSKQLSTTWQGDVQQLTVETSESVQNFIRSQEQVLEDRLLLDASTLKQGVVSALELTWKFAMPGNRVFYIELKGSDDLSSWRTIHARHKLIELNTGQRVVLENSIPLGGTAFNYYQLRFLGQPIPAVTEVKALLKNQALEQPLLSMNVAGFNVLDSEREGHGIIWQTGGFFPIESIQLDFDYKNLMADVQLFSRSTKNSPWRKVASSQLYQVGSGDMAMEKNSLNFPAIHHRFWKLTTQSSISSQWIKGVSMAWRPHQLQFLAQGSGPYNLYFGADDLSSHASNRWYQQLNSQLKTSLFSDQIQAGSLKKIAKAPQEVVTEPESTLGRWIFWSLLVVVLSALLYMASRLLREVNEEGE